MQRANSVDEYIADARLWKGELHQLRDILRATRLTEEVKWGGPCYTYKGKNVVGIGGFKSYFGLWFHQGALLKDDKKLLINAQEGKTRALRQWRMLSGKDIKPTIIKRYGEEAISRVDQGREIRANRKRPIEAPPELQKALRTTQGCDCCISGIAAGAAA
jgi:uncharacterized protein YdeI (YjbR/CyaY-like superfamily)